MRTKISGGSSGIPGVTGDGQTPPGENIEGAIQVGYPPTPALIFNALYGSTFITNNQGTLDDSDAPLYVGQRGTLSQDTSAPALAIDRTVSQNGYDFASAAMRCDDNSTSNVPVAMFVKQGTLQFQVNPDGVTIHDKIRTGASVAHSLGAYSGNAVPIYDEFGVLLGYMPLYA